MVLPIPSLGLNPILQDPALAIHPPLLYRVCRLIDLFFCCDSIFVNKLFRKIFAQSIKNWVLISWSFQTLGILAGSVWAYYELGWGGFWFWDPVENAFY